MSLVLVERCGNGGADELLDLQELESKERAFAHCLAIRRVKPLVSYVSFDQRRTVCFYEAPDAESVRETQDQAQLTYEMIYSTIPFGDGLLDEPSPKTAVLCARPLPANLGEDYFFETSERTATCKKMYSVTHSASFLSLDRTRSMCLYAAPDAEAIRILNEQHSLPWEYVFAARTYPADPSDARSRSE